MASLSRGISFRRQGSSGMSWTDTWSFNEEGVLVRTMKEEVQQCFAGSSLARIHDLQADDEEADIGQHSNALLGRSKSVGTSTSQGCLPPKPSPKFFKWLKKALLKLKK